MCYQLNLCGKDVAVAELLRVALIDVERFTTRKIYNVLKAL